MIKSWHLIPLSFSLITVCLTGFAQSQGELGTVEGVLLDAANQRPLRGVGVRLIGSDTEDKTDIKGQFSLTVPAGDYAGLVVVPSGGAGISLIEAQVTVEAGVSDDLGEIETQPASSPPVQVSPEGSMSPDSSMEENPPPPGPQVQFLPWLGILPQEVPADYGPRGGSPVAVVVGKVFRGSPAAMAGFQEGDFIDSVGDQPVTNGYQFAQLIASSPLEGPVEISVTRRGQVIPLSPWLVPVPEAAIMAIRELSQGGAMPPGMGGPSPGGEMQPPQSIDSGVAPPHPLLREARRQADRGNFLGADRAYDEYLRSNPPDGLVWAEYAEMVYHNIQQARGMQLMAQAVKKPGLPPQEKTRLRLIIAQRRLESGNLVTAQQMLIEAKREDPFNPIIDDLLQTIEIIVLQSSGKVPGPPQAVPLNQPGGQAEANQVLLNELMSKISKELSKE
ncbi:MAG: PDZ domain-containing protein [Candidatus Omnitrophica bacterium]|nr:PDZ domain-containing protein [Candidatus Omnitrophota bacterium]